MKKSIKILIVDDIDANLYLLRVLLLNAGYDIVEAINGKVALEVAESNDVDLIISDILMPTMDGFELCKIWKTSEKLKKIPFIFYTATYTEQKDREFALNIGADLFLVKPMESYNLLREVDKVLKNLSTSSSANVINKVSIKEKDYYERYSSRLVKKLEEKLIQLEQKNYELMSRDTNLRQLNDTLSFKLDKLKLTEKNIMAHEVELLSIINFMTEGVMTTDKRGIISVFNPAAEKILGYSRADIVGKSIGVLLPEKFREHHNDLRADFVESDVSQLVARDMRALTKQGSEIPIRLSVSRLPLSELSQPMFICSFLDVSKEKEQEKIIARSHKMDAIGALSGGIAHDYNNMLGVILGYSEMILANSLDEKSKSQAKKICHAADRGASLTRKLLSFSKKSNESTSSVNLNDVINDNIDMLNKVLINKVELVCELNEVPLISVDVNDFEDCILNLFINAKHAMPDGGRLHIKTDTVVIEKNNTMHLAYGKYLCFSIADNGSGMTKDVLDKIFDPFFTTKGTNGTGLGLSQAYGFVKRSKGYVNVESTLGEGTTFVFYFPESFKTDDTKKIAQETSKEIIKETLSVLVVDDEAVLLSLIETFLNEMGFDVLTAKDADDAFNLLKNNHVDVLISDVIMPGIGGEEFVLRASELYSDLKILLMSGYNEIKANKFPLISKPFTYSEFNKVIDKLLNTDTDSD